MSEAELKAELEAYRRREVDGLRSALAAAEEQAEHYRQEALRNAEVGRQIADEARKTIARLQRELDACRQSNVYAERFRRTAPARG